MNVEGRGNKIGLFLISLPSNLLVVGATLLLQASSPRPPVSYQRSWRVCFFVSGDVYRWGEGRERGREERERDIFENFNYKIRLLHYIL